VKEATEESKDAVQAVDTGKDAAAHAAVKNV
jgi:hypothetical protein